MARQSFFRWCYCFLVLFLAWAPAGWCEDIQPTENWQTLLNEALLISQRLEQLNEQLSSELTALRSHSAELEKKLAKLLNEHEVLRSELYELRQKSETLSQLLEASEQELKPLREQLQKAEDSSAAFEESFTSYRLLAEAKIRSLKLQRNLAVGGGILAVLLAIIFGSR